MPKTPKNGSKPTVHAKPANIDGGLAATTAVAPSAPQQPVFVLTRPMLAGLVNELTTKTTKGKEDDSPFGPSPYVKYGFEFLKLGTELMSIFGNLKPMAFNRESVADAPRFSGIYLVLRGDNLVYVGISDRLRSRLQQHVNGSSNLAQALKGKYRPNHYREFLGENFQICFKEVDDLPYAIQLEHVIIGVFRPMFNLE